MQGPEEPGEAPAIHHDGVVDFIPEGPIKIPGGDAEVTADVDDDCADRPAPHLGGDFLLGGQMGEMRIVVGGQWSGLDDRWRDLACWALCARRRQAHGRHREISAAGGAGLSLASSAAARRTPRVMRARMSARSAVPKGLTKGTKPEAAARC